MAFANSVLTDRAQFFKDLSMPFYGANRSSARVSQGVMDSFLAARNGRRVSKPRLIASRHFPRRISRKI